MITPETTAKTDGPILGSSSFIGANDSLLNNNKSTTTKINGTELKNPSIQKLSNYISLNLKKLFLDKNRTALHDYEKFLKIIKRNHSISKTRKNNFIQHYYKYPYKDNPKLIISSYNTKIFGDINEKANKKYKVDIIGVDEGYIHLPKFHNNEFSRLLNEQDNFDSKKDKENLEIPKIKINKINTNIKVKYFKNNLNKTDDLIIKKAKIKIKKRNLTERERGEEFMSTIGTARDENETLFYKKSSYEKMKENFEARNNYKYEIKKLENWDFEHCLKDKMKKFLSKEKISQILKKPENSQMKWYIDMKSDKKQRKLMCRNRHLKEFFERIEKEQNAIFLQTISINKKDFNFDVFKTENNDEKDKEKEKGEGEGTVRQIEFYKDVMKEKHKIEEMFHSELTNCAEEVHFTRIRKEEAIVELYEISQKINEIKKEEQEIKEKYEKDMGIMNEYTDVLNILARIASEKNANNGNKNKNFERRKSKIGISPKKSKQLLNAIKADVTSNENKKIALRRGSIKRENNLLEENENQKYKFNLERLDLSAFNEKANLFQLQSDLIAQKNLIKKKYNSEMAKITEDKSDLNFQFKEKKEEMKNLSALSKKAKSNLDLRIKTLSGYYYQILKKGIDVRKSGLSWVIVKLMELRVYVDKHYFPQFLDDEQICYILKIGVKIHELNELIKLFQILKEKQKALRDNYITEEVKKEKEMESNKFLNLIQNKKKIGDNYVKYIEDLQIKYENVINICLNENREEEKINKIKDELKEQILKSKYVDELEFLNEPELYFIPGTLAAFFSQDKRFRQYFDDVFYLNEEINKRKKDIMEEKEKEFKKFRNKYGIDDSKKRKDKTDNANSIKNEQMYAALFGNGISF